MLKRSLLSGLLAGAAFFATASTTSAYMGMQEGALKVSWGYRGQTCHIRYTEMGEYIDKYHTSAGCDEGSTVIRGLVAGQKYQVQVSQDKSNWSNVVYGTARGVMWDQQMVYQPEMRYHMAKAEYMPVHKAKYYTPANGNGVVHVVWAHRGGQCWVRYTEADQKMYKYSTVASCDDGHVAIKALVEGRKYRFQVSQDGVNWSRPAYAVAQ